MSVKVRRGPTLTGQVNFRRVTTKVAINFGYQTVRFVRRSIDDYVKISIEGNGSSKMVPVSEKPVFKDIGELSFLEDEFILPVASIRIR